MSWIILNDWWCNCFTCLCVTSQICLPIPPLFIRPPIHPPTRPSICVCLSISLPLNLSIHLSVYLWLKCVCLCFTHGFFCLMARCWKQWWFYEPLVLLVSLAGLGWLCLPCLLVVDSCFICLCCRYSALSLHTWEIGTARSITHVPQQENKAIRSTNKTRLASPSGKNPMKTSIHCNVFKYPFSLDSDLFVSLR